MIINTSPHALIALLSAGLLVYTCLHGLFLGYVAFCLKHRPHHLLRLRITSLETLQRAWYRNTRLALVLLTMTLATGIVSTSLETPHLSHKEYLGVGAWFLTIMALLVYRFQQWQTRMYSILLTISLICVMGVLRGF